MAACFILPNHYVRKQNLIFVRISKFHELSRILNLPVLQARLHIVSVYPQRQDMLLPYSTHR